MASIADVYASPSIDYRTNLEKGGYSIDFADLLEPGETIVVTPDVSPFARIVHKLLRTEVADAVTGVSLDGTAVLVGWDTTVLEVNTRYLVQVTVTTDAGNVPSLDIELVIV